MTQAMHAPFHSATPASIRRGSGGGGVSRQIYARSVITIHWHLTTRFSPPPMLHARHRSSSRLTSAWLELNWDKCTIACTASLLKVHGIREWRVTKQCQHEYLQQSLRRIGTKGLWRLWLCSRIHEMLLQQIMNELNLSQHSWQHSMAIDDGVSLWSKRINKKVFDCYSPSM